MLNPFDVEDLRKKIVNTQTPFAIYNWAEFYKVILKDIAEGSIDPKSLARAALGMKR